VVGETRGEQKFSASGYVADLTINATRLASQPAQRMKRQAPQTRRVSQRHYIEASVAIERVYASTKHPSTTYRNVPTLCRVRSMIMATTPVRNSTIIRELTMLK
jgi:hypothetical protein